MNSLRIVLTMFMLLAWSSETWCLIKHCDSKTDAERDKLLEGFTELRKFLQTDKEINGRLGTVMFANWQDQVLHIEAPEGIECLWKMKSVGDDKEAGEFNGKGYTGRRLYAAPLQKTQYVRTISCETDACTQFYNVVSRPITKPDFPVQVYVGNKIDIACSLEMMKESKNLLKPPYQFIWTGPKDCEQSNWDSKDPKKCIWYSSHSVSDPQKCKNSQGCSFNIDTSYTPVNGTAKGGYKKTKIKITGEKLKGEDSQYLSTLSIEEASEDHDGQWRCIVIDKFGVSSDMLLEDHRSYFDNNIIHRGIVNLHVKSLWFALGIPVGIIVGVIILSLLCILICKQCTDFEITPEEEPVPDKTQSKNQSEKSNVPSSTSVTKSSAPSNTSVKPGAE